MAMAVMVLNDDDVLARLDAGTAVRAVTRALLEAHAGTLHTPARARAQLGVGDMVFTAGHLRSQGVFGFRAYDTIVDAEQLVAVWDAEDGRLRTVVHGQELGPRRTGAIGAVAVDAASRPGPLRLGLVGAGPQAWAQLWALRAVREVEEVLVATRRPDRAEAFARRAADELGLTVTPVPAVETAVRERDVVIVATDSARPVVEAAWIAPGTHVSTLGPRTTSRHELPVELLERAHVVLTDSPVQEAAYGEPNIFPPDRMVHLGAALAGAVPARTGSDDITVFCSAGLAGTEVAVAAALARRVTDANGR